MTTIDFLRKGIKSYNAIQELFEWNMMKKYRLKYTTYPPLHFLHLYYYFQWSSDKYIFSGIFNSFQDCSYLLFKFLQWVYFPLYYFIFNFRSRLIFKLFCCFLRKSYKTHLIYYLYHHSTGQPITKLCAIAKFLGIFTFYDVFYVLTL